MNYFYTAWNIPPIRALLVIIFCSMVASIDAGEHIFKVIAFSFESIYEGSYGEIIPTLWEETFFFELAITSLFFVFNNKAREFIGSKLFKSENAMLVENPVINLGLKEDVAWVVVDLRTRAKSLESRASIFLFLIVVLLCSAVTLVIFAGRLTNLDVTVGNKAEIAKSLTDAAERDYKNSLSELREEISDYNWKLEELKGDNKEAKAKLLKERYFGENGRITHLKILHKEKESQYKAASANLAEANKLVLFEDAADLKDLNFLYATGVTRFGIIVIVFFFVKILLDFYKYSIRLSSYYKARSDALVIAGKYDQKFHKLLPELSPESLDFGKQPKLPVDYFKNITTELLSSIKNESSGKEKVDKKNGDDSPAMEKKVNV